MDRLKKELGVECVDDLAYIEDAMVKDMKLPPVQVHMCIYMYVCVCVIHTVRMSYGQGHETPAQACT